ncbi:hypothetical protein V6N11_061161 [Hibiscus sabdariffa]|uniref:Uncharacterized protein n=1 Tax=Hibiscus sabdariffa TaxID=183260 RepID=A0ABR2A1F0_9ROSI
MQPRLEEQNLIAKSSTKFRSTSQFFFTIGAAGWAFIRKVYSILALQLLATVAVAATVVFLHPIARFIVGTVAGFALYIVILFTPLISAFLLPFVHCTSITRDIHGVFFCLEFSPLLSLLPLD